MMLLILKAAELEAVKDSFREVKDCTAHIYTAAIKPDLDVQFLFVDKPFGYREYFIPLVLLWSI